MQLEENDFVQWRSHPISKALFKWFENEISLINQELSEGVFILQEQGQLLGAKKIGIREGLELAKSVQYQDLQNKEDKDE